MSEDFVPDLEILQPPQRRLWDEFGDIPSDFVLYGGTAIALHLGHRASIDFDFFCRTTFDGDRLLNELALLRHAEVSQRAPSTLSCIVDRGGPIRLSFFGVPSLTRLRPALIAPCVGLRVASLLDLAGTKASVVQRRAEAKDYIDLDAIFLDGQINLSLALAAASAIYQERFNPQITLKALSYFEDGDVRHLPEDMKFRLTAAARNVNLRRLPVIEPMEEGYHQE